MNRHRIAALAAALTTFASAAEAQHIVHDPTAYAQLVREARTALEQLEQLREQVRQGQALFDTLNDLSDVNRIAQELGLPEVRSPLPELRNIRAAAEGDLSALGSLAARADAIRAGLPLDDVATILGWELNRVKEIARRYVTGEAIGLGMIARLQETRNRRPTVKPAVKLEPRRGRSRRSNPYRTVAGELGLEPRMTVPKTVVLPLHHSPAVRCSPPPQCVAARSGQIRQGFGGCNT